MTPEKINSILLLGKETLLAQVPASPINMHSYQKLKKINPDWHRVLICLAGRLNGSKRRARKMNFKFDLTLKHLAELWIDQQGRCPLTGVILEFNSGSREDKNPRACSIDRIYNEFGYIEGNVELLTHWANNAKNTWGRDLFEEMIIFAAKKVTEPRQLDLF